MSDEPSSGYPPVIPGLEQTKPPVTHLGAKALAIAGFTCYVLCDSVMKYAGRAQIPNFEIVAFLGVFMTIFITGYALLRGQVRELWPKRSKRLLVRSLLDLGNNICVVIALRHLTLTLFYILVFTSPMLVAFLGRMFLNERLDWRKVVAIVTGFLGVIVAVYPSRSGAHSALIGLAACTASMTCFSIGMVWARKISQSERIESISFMSGLVAATAGLIGTFFHFAPVSSWLLAALIVMSLLGVVGNICTFAALKYTTAATVSQYHYTQLLSGAIVAYFLFHEVPTLWMLAGAVLIIGAGLYIAMRRPVQEM